MKKTILALGFLAMISSCTQQREDADNPLLRPSDLFMGAPDFANIKNDHFAPAFDAAMKEQLAIIDTIVNNKEAATFDNTILKLELSGSTLRRVSNIFFGLVSADTNDELRKIEAEYSPKLTAHSDAIYLNDALFARVKSVYETQLQGLDGEDKRLVEFYYDNFVRSGANLDEASKAELKKINSELSSLTTEFGQKLTNATYANYVVVDNQEALAGLTEDEIAAAAEAAISVGQKGKYVLQLTNTTQQPQMASLENRDVRRRFYEASVNRCSKGDDNDTGAIILRIVKLRAQKAKLLGYNTFAAWKLEDQMAKTPEQVHDFLKTLADGYTKRAKLDAAEIEQYMRRLDGDSLKLEAWDWAYYAEKLRKEKYDVDENMLKSYFVLDSVLQNGVFYAANQLYGLSFKERKDLPVYQEDVRVFDVFDKDGQQLALLYTDFYKRPSKSGGAWMSNWQDQSSVEGTKPIIYNVCNYNKPEAGKPCLLTFDEVGTLFHEFGHTLHGLFASQKYVSLSGTAVPRDFVEMPSQFNEHWAVEPAVLKNYAKHYQTGEIIPDSLVDRMNRAATFNQAYAFGENLGAVTVDMAWHSLSADQAVADVAAFEAAALTKMGILNAQIPPRYKSPYFRHIFSNEYAAGYYAYLWSEVLDQNIYTWFKANGGMTSENGQRFRDLILSKGHTEDLSNLFMQFTGLAKPRVEDLLRSKGVL